MTLSFDKGYLYQELRQLVELDRLPGAAELRRFLKSRDDLPAFSTVAHNLTWEVVRKEMNATDEAHIENYVYPLIREISKDGKMPQQLEYEAARRGTGIMSLRTLKEKLNMTWNQIAVELNLAPGGVRRAKGKFDARVTAANLRSIAVNGRMPTNDAYTEAAKANNWHSVSTIINPRNAGSWAAMAAIAGLSYDQNWTDEEIIARGIELSTPTKFVTGEVWAANKIDGQPGITKVGYLFDGWAGFARACGYGPDMEPLPDEPTEERPRVQPKRQMVNPAFLADNYRPQAKRRA